ncbi:MAG TPA: hypothetical protein DCX53_15915 [Anaerolineae bacterium]|nr:hypothetical protein [Anaerolineae bacterium]
MKANKRFTSKVLESISKDKILGMRAGRGTTHPIIGIWAVVVERRVFVRSWSMKPRGWWRTFLEDPQGIIVLGEKEIPVRAIQTRSDRLKDLVSAAFKEKYSRPGDIQYVKDMSRKKSRDTTTELTLI